MEAKILDFNFLIFDNNGEIKVKNHAPADLLPGIKLTLF
jgi:hypothetical protein